jgi:hypothetical protein
MVAGGTRNARDLGGGQTRHHFQGQRGLGLRREHRMAGGEHQPQHVVLYRLRQLELVGWWQPTAEQLDLAGKRDVPADLVDRPALGHGHQPGARPVGDAGGRPLLEGSHQRVLGQVLGPPDVVDQPGEACDEAGRLDPPDRLDGAVGGGTRHPVQVTARPPTRATS